MPGKIRKYENLNERKLDIQANDRFDGFVKLDGKYEER
jgi:hypothetical protein